MTFVLFVVAVVEFRMLEFRTVRLKVLLFRV